MSRKTSLPRFNRASFFRLAEDELIVALAGAFAEHAERHPGWKPTAAHESLVAWGRLAVDVPNGGFTQFFYNHGSDEGVAAVAKMLDSLGLPKAGAVLRQALAVYRKHRKKFAVTDPWDGLFGSIPEFDKLDRTFMDVVLRGNRALEKWVRGNIAKLADGDDGAPIDPLFTGTVEARQANGQVGESLEVKKGKPSGAYREFFEDGSLRNAQFYKAGKISGDFWPSGQIKRQESRRGKLKVIEWFYPGGQLQKHLVMGKDSYAVGAVQLFHENGLLAEEVNVAKDKKRGRWVKFFEDGSPRLEAEYAAGEKLIVHNSWDDDRKQVVKNGKGTFHDDGLQLDWEYDLYLKHQWTSDQELKNGIPHGKTTRYNDGVLWSVSFFEKGKPTGESTLYWDNGRIRMIDKRVGGKIKTELFPKFDEPKPAVLLTVRADEELYTAWRHIPVDEYPRALNLEEISKQLQVPDFLQKVYECNVAGEVEDDYDDWNTFNDGIAYFLMVNEKGEVTIATANGSGVRSGGHWDTYPPLLRRLRFAPGRIRGHALPCRVLANVDHTFVEGKTGK